MAHATNIPVGASAQPTSVTSSPAYQGYLALRLGFTVAPIIAGADKYFHLLVDWDQYLAPVFASFFGGDGHAFMLIVGVVEIVAGIGVALRPRIFGYIVSAWLVGIIINLLLHPGSYDATGWGLDLALRDLGLAIGAFALARLSQEFGK
jgi:hypothetical protein